MKAILVAVKGKFINNKADYTLICICLFFYFNVFIIYILWGFIELDFF